MRGQHHLEEDDHRAETEDDSTQNRALSSRRKEGVTALQGEREGGKERGRRGVRRMERRRGGREREREYAP